MKEEWRCKLGLGSVKPGWVMSGQIVKGQASLSHVRSGWVMVKPGWVMVKSSCVMSGQVGKGHVSLDNCKPCLGIMCGIESV